MRLLYADPGLLNNQGHHANSCRSLRREFRRQGRPVTVLGCRDMHADLQAELGANRFFHGYTYQTLSDGDPVCGTLNAFDAWSRMVRENLRNLQAIGADDVVYLNSAQPAQFMGLVMWWKALPVNHRPWVVLEFGTDPGVDVSEVLADGRVKFSLRDYRIDSRPMFYRYAGRGLQPEDLAKFHLATFDDTTSAVFSGVIGLPVEVLPLPQDSHPPLHSRQGRRPITIGVVGHQRPDKGYQHLPELAKQLLAADQGVRFLIQNSVPADMPRTHEAMREFARSEPRVEIDERAAGGADWAAVLRRCDLMLCPYDPQRYIASYSAVATDAVANGIPLVVPQGTSMARLLAKYGDPGVAYVGNDVASILDATRRALDQFDVLAARADRAAAKWNATMGAANTAKAILRLCKAGKPEFRMMQAS